MPNCNDTMDLDGIKEIQEKAIRQNNYLPVLKEKHETLDKEFDAAIENNRKKRECNATYRLETDLVMVKLRGCERHASQEAETMRNVQSDTNFCRKFIAQEDQETDNMTLKYEQDLKEIGELFRSAPLQYEVNTLTKEAEEIRNCAFRLKNELADLKRKIDEIKQQFNQRVRIRDDGVLTGVDALAEIQSDGVLCDNIISALKSKQKLYEKQVTTLNHDLNKAYAIKETLMDA